MLGIAHRAASLVDAERGVPLSLQARPCEDRHPGKAAARLLLEWTSRGDRVPAELWLPAGVPSAPLVLLQYGAGGSIDEDHLHPVATLLGAGLAVATVDWPLHGRRASPKLSSHLLAALDREDPGPNSEPLVEQFALQSALDLSRAIDAIGSLDAPVDAGRVGVVGVGLGAPLAALFAAVDPRPGALALVPTRRGTRAARIEAGPLLAASRARPVLLVASREAPAVAASEVEALRQACPGDARIEWTGDRVEPLSAEAASPIASFVAQTLARDA